MSDDTRPARQIEEHRAVVDAVEVLLPMLETVAERTCAAFAAGGRLYSFGNGGSAADAQHLAAELIGRFRRERRPLPAVALSVDPSVMTCIANDYAFDAVFARQVDALAGPNDVVVAFTTSGRSQNVVDGLAMARRRGATTVLFGGDDGGPAREHADFALIVPGTITARIQEMHLLMLHLLSDAIDRWAAGDGAPPSVVGSAAPSVAGTSSPAAGSTT
jgi:D-sedoheptulose 7-phosphate isomerase